MTAHGEGVTADPATAAVSAVEARKGELRRLLLAARRAVPATERARRADALSMAVVGLAARTGGPVCAYLPIGTEPGSVAGLDALRAAGHTVLLPVVPAVAGPLDWAGYEGPGSLADGPLGLREPMGRRLGVSGITTARLVLVPALAVDRLGNRLGRGGGFYDRTLPLAAPGALVCAVIHDDELIDELPADPHDVAVAAVMRPTPGMTMLRAAG